MVRLPNEMPAQSASTVTAPAPWACGGSRLIPSTVAAMTKGTITETRCSRGSVALHSDDNPLATSCGVATSKRPGLSRHSPAVGIMRGRGTGRRPRRTAQRRPYRGRGRVFATRPAVTNRRLCRGRRTCSPLRKRLERLCRDTAVHAAPAAAITRPGRGWPRTAYQTPSSASVAPTNSPHINAKPAKTAKGRSRSLSRNQTAKRMSGMAR